jgi:hypothetical protein
MLRSRVRSQRRLGIERRRRSRCLHRWEGIAGRCSAAAGGENSGKSNKEGNAFHVRDAHAFGFGLPPMLARLAPYIVSVRLNL